MRVKAGTPSRSSHVERLRWSQHSRMPLVRTLVTLHLFAAVTQQQANSQLRIELWVSKTQAAGGHLVETSLGHDICAGVRGVPSFGSITGAGTAEVTAGDGATYTLTGAGAA